MLEAVVPPLRVLLVEDNRADAYFFQAALKDSEIPADVTIREDGAEAWKAIAASSSSAEKFDLIVLDINLPGLDGKQILGMMSLDSRLSKTPVAVFSSSSNFLKEELEPALPNLRLLFESKTDNFLKLQTIIRRFVKFARDGGGSRTPTAMEA